MFKSVIFQSFIPFITLLNKILDIVSCLSLSFIHSCNNIFNNPKMLWKTKIFWSAFESVVLRIASKSCMHAGSSFMAGEFCSPHFRHYIVLSALSNCEEDHLEWWVKLNWYFFVLLSFTMCSLVYNIIMKPKKPGNARKSDKRKLNIKGMGKTCVRNKWTVTEENNLWLILIIF